MCAPQTAQNSVPAIYDLRAATAAGGLISYASSNLGAQQQAGVYAGRILKERRVKHLNSCLRRARKPEIFRASII
jgi:hypothetical protein